MLKTLAYFSLPSASTISMLQCSKELGLNTFGCTLQDQPQRSLMIILCPRKNPKIQEPCKNKAIRCTGAKDQLKNARRNKKRLGFNLPPPSLCFFGFSNGLSI